MPITNLLFPRMICLLVLAIACIVPTHALAQTEQEKDKAAAPQEKKLEEKKPDTTSRGNIEILSDTMGVDFAPYLRSFKTIVQSHWEPLIPASAMPPMMKSGAASIELAILKNGQVMGMKLVKSSGDVALDRAAWGGITGSIPLPTLPSAFKGEYLLLRCNFLYNPEKPETTKAPEPAKQEPKK